MKRQKRDRLERAHQRGYQAGIAGRSKEMCPYQALNQRSQWLGGWREAIGDRAVLALYRLFKKKPPQCGGFAFLEGAKCRYQKAEVSWNRPTFRSFAV